MLLIAPYPDLAKTAQETLSHSPHSVKVVLGDLQKGLRVAHEELDRSNADSVVSRGGTASLLRQDLSIPVFEIDVSGYDLLRAIYPHVKRKRKIAVVGYENVVSGARSIAETLGIDLGFFLVASQRHINEVVREACTWGAEIVVGDTISVNTAQMHGLDTELVRSGPEAILRAVEVAANYCSHMQEEIIRNKRLNSIMEHSDRGVLYLNTENVIELINTKAEKILRKNRNQLIGSSFTSKTIPDSLAQTLLSSSNNRLIKINEKDYTVEVLPMHTDGMYAATLVFIQSAGYIRDLEGMIRRQMTSRGLIAVYSFESLIARNPRFKKTIEKARRYSQTNSTILLLGETGSGKEVFAQSIHNASPRGGGPFVAVNCAALPDSLLESELFGYAEGAFTGARKGGKPGLFEMAHMGTIFLDEVNEMSNVVQARFLRVLQERQVMRLGDNRIYNVDVRVIAACNKDLYAETEAGRFRQDLYYRLRVLDIEILPLRKRPEDIIPLFNSFMNHFREKYSYESREISKRLIGAMLAYPWPGNIRQLRNFAEKVCVLCSIEKDREEIVEDLIQELSQHNHQTDKAQQDTYFAGNGGTLKEIEAAIILDCWERNGRNASETARQLGIDRATLRKRINTS